MLSDRERINIATGSALTINSVGKAWSFKKGDNDFTGIFGLHVRNQVLQCKTSIATSGYSTIEKRSVLAIVESIFIGGFSLIVFISKLSVYGFLFVAAHLYRATVIIAKITDPSSR